MSLAGFVGARRVDRSALLAPVELYAGRPGAQKGAAGFGGTDTCALDPSTGLGITSASKITNLK